MIMQTYRRQMQGRRRSAFTLLEVLVVVAILVVLASVASVYVFRYLDDAKKDKAYLQAKNIEKAAKSYIAKHATDPDMEELTSINQLVQPNKGAPFLEGGAAAIVDPWNNPFQIAPNQGANGEVIIEVYTKAPDGEVISSAKRRS